MAVASIAVKCTKIGIKLTENICRTKTLGTIMESKEVIGMKRLGTAVLFFMFTLLLCFTALAAQSWVNDSATGTKIGIVNDHYTLISATWSGPAVDGKAEGKGTLTMTIRDKAGKTYTGTGEAEMKAGLMHGQVLITWTDGEAFNGTYKDGIREKGVYKIPSGDVYEGDFKNNVPDGYGVYTFADGSRYEGQWKNGLKDGRGIMKWADGRIYEGDFKNDKLHGFGVGKDAAGKVVHDGEWKDGKPWTKLKTDSVLGVPWGATEEQAKEILLKRPNTIRVSFLDGKNGDHRWLYFGGPFADIPDAWIYVHFYQGKMWQFRISWPLKEAQTMDRYNTLKQGLAGRYGPPSSEEGKNYDSRAWWELGQNYYVGIEILQNTTKIAPADPTPTTHPFRVYITYYNKDIVDILYSNKQPNSSNVSKDY